MRLLKSNPSGRLFLVSLMVIMACLLIPGAFAASATADHINDKGYTGTGTIVNFTTDPAPTAGVVTITAGQSVKFFDNSSVNITSRLWDFDDRSTSTDANPTHTFNTVGRYNITLGATNATGYASNVSGQTVNGYKLPYIQVNPAGTFVPAFNVTLNGVNISVADYAKISGKVNVGDSLVFYDLSTPAGSAKSWSWNFGDGSPLDTNRNATHTFSQIGNYTVRFTPSTSTSPGTIVKTVDIEVTGVRSPVSNFSATNGIETQIAQPFDKEHIVDYTIAYAANQVLNGTAPMAVSFTDKSTKSPTALNWNFSYKNNYNADNVSTLTNPTHTFPVGQYLVVLNSKNTEGSNESYLWVNVQGPEQPVATIQPNVTTGASPLTVRLNATWPADTASTKVPSTFLWDFGDGTQGSTDRNVTHVFTTTADVDYTVKLTVRNGFSTAGETTQVIHVTKAGIPDAHFQINSTDASPSWATNGNTFSGKEIVVGQPINFNDTSSNYPTEYNWIFSDGQGASTQDKVVHTFTAPGSYWVYHTAKNSAGEKYWLTVLNVVAAQTVGVPTAHFTANVSSGAQGPVIVKFTNESTGTKPTTFQWLINGQQVGTEENLTYTFPGVTVDTTYTVALVAGTSTGSTSYTESFKVTPVSDIPVSDFTYTPTTKLAVPITIQFNYNATGNATQFLWNFDDGTTSDLKNPTHEFKTVGNFTVKLTASNLKGSSSTSQSITTEPLGTPVAWFTANNVDITGDGVIDARGKLPATAAPFTVNFTAPADSRINAYYWDFGDGTINTTARNVTHTYTTSNKYSVYLVVANSLGYDYIYAKDLVNATAAKPVADFTASRTTGGAPLTVSFTDTTTNSPFIWAWNFGDGNISGAKNPTYTYTKAGNYTVTLTAQNAAGQSVKPATMNITVNNVVAPVANFTFAPSTGQAPLNVTFTDTSSNSPTSWLWTFIGAGVTPTTSTLQNPQHVFEKAGQYAVYLTATNSEGSTTATPQFITVSAAPVTVADFTANTTSGVAPLAVQFTDKSTNAMGWVWDFGDKSVGSVSQNPSHTYTTAGIYTVSLQAYNTTIDSTNTKTATITVTGAPSTLQAAFNVNAQAVQIGQTVTGTDASTGYPATWSWDFGDGFGTSDVQTINHAYTTAGQYNLSLTVKNGTQTSMASKTITVTAVPTTPTTTVAPGLPYNGPHNAPGTVQAEDYDLGGNTVAYADTTSGNAGGAYRTDDVDIEAVAGGYTVAYVISGEYLTYAVDAAAAGDYTIALKAANPDAAAKTVTVSTGSSSTTVSVSSTGSFNTFNTFTSAGTLSLAAGRNVVKVAFGASRMNLDSFTIGAGVQPTTTITTQPTSTVTTQPTTGAASFTVSPTSGKKSLTVALTDTTTGGNPVSYKWTCGNGQTFTGKSVGLNRIWYNNAGTYTITLTVTDANGSTRTATKTVTVTN